MGFSAGGTAADYLKGLPKIRAHPRKSAASFGSLEMAEGHLFAGSGKAEYLCGLGRSGAGHQFVGDCEMLAEIRNLGGPRRASDDTDDPAAIHLRLRAGAQ